MRGFSHLQLISLLALVSASFALTSCLNNAGTDSTASGSSSSGSKNTGTAGNLPSSGNVSFITLTKAVRSNVDPSGTLDLIGTNGEIGASCPNATDCKCVYNFTEPSSGILREVEQALTRAETDLARCPFTQVSTEATFFDISLKIVALNQGSNKLRVFIGSQDPSLDPSISSNYSPVQRYQCRDILTKAANTGFYNNTLLDPRLWDLSLSFNFYSTSLGRDYGAVAPASNGGSPNLPGFECPPIPNDQSDNPVYDLKLFSLAPLDLNNPTAVDVVIGDNTIFPADDNINLAPAKCVTGTESTCEKFANNRSDYYVANFKSGIFKEAVCIFHRVSNIASSAALDCTIDTSKGAPVVGSAAVGKDIIGFAAIPDANQACPSPSIVKIPAGKKFVKLWQFRTSFAPRTINDVANPSDIGDLFCTTREKECKINGNDPVGGANDGANSVCYNTSSPTGPNIGVQQSAQLGSSLASPGFGNCDERRAAGDGRGDGAAGIYNGIVAGSACVGLTDAGTAFNCCRDDLNLNGPTENNLPANFTPGGQWCNPGLVGSNDASSTPSSVGGLAQDVWLMGNGGRRPCIEADTDAAGRYAMAPNLPDPLGAYIISPRPIDTESRFDFVYVVTPASVTVEQMLDPLNANQKIAKQYTPQRQKPNGTPGDMQVYQLTLGSDNSQNPGNRVSRFPLCVLQDVQQGAASP